ncbi:hypothetical protein BZA77DRAFT_32583 [Pyronema omphalodes]|nr:hypothetical protein BZA77DRAFT_32583 [Pyronema omphalodes]
MYTWSIFANWKSDMKRKAAFGGIWCLTGRDYQPNFASIFGLGVEYPQPGRISNISTYRKKYVVVVKSNVDPRNSPQVFLVPKAHSSPVRLLSAVHIEKLSQLSPTPVLSALVFLSAARVLVGCHSTLEGDPPNPTQLPYIHRPWFFFFFFFSQLLLYFYEIPPTLFLLPLLSKEKKIRRKK